MIYLDYAASNPPYPQVTEKMGELMRQNFGNASGIHSMAEKSRLLIRQSRKALAELMGVQPQQVFFTSGATEANNWAVKQAAVSGKRHMLIFAAEHSSVINSARYMAARGFEVTWLRPDGNGVLPVETVENAVRPDTGFLSVQAVNNETGVMQDVEALSDRILLIGNGRILMDGTFEDVKKIKPDYASLDELAFHLYKKYGITGGDA